MRNEVNPRLLRVIFIVVLVSCSLAYSQNLGNEPTPAVKIVDGMYWMGDFECNVVASIGPDGVLLVDSGYSDNADQIRSIIKTLSVEPIRIIINTHFHFDHVGCNEALAKDGALIIAQNKTRERMTIEWKPREMLGVRWPDLPPYSSGALPKIGFMDSIALHFNNDMIEAIHLPAAHTDGDIVIRFRKANIVHTGDLYLSNGFPIIDIDSGGTIAGYLEAVDRIITLCDNKTKIIPGHGPISDLVGLRAYRNMLTIARDRIVKLISEGKTLEEIVAADPAKGLFQGGKSWLDPKLFIFCVYQDLAGK